MTMARLCLWLCEVFPKVNLPYSVLRRAADLHRINLRLP